jgi:hypothetical protein
MLLAGAACFDNALNLDKVKLLYMETGNAKLASNHRLV